MPDEQPLDDPPLLPAPPEARAALAALHGTVRARRRGNIGAGELLYRAYTTVLLALFGFYLALGIVDDAPIGVGEIDWVRDHGAAWVGLVAAMSLAAGLRSGAGGGPLAIDEVDLHHLVMSPIDRRIVLGPSMRRLALGAVGLGAVGGAAAGELASRRLPGGAWSWVASGVVCGVTIALGAVAVALATASTRLLQRRPWIATLVASIVVGASVVDISRDTGFAPGSVVGRIALWPLTFAPWPIVASAIVLGLFVMGYARIAGLSIERATRRAHLVRQVRFALAQQDVRSLILLRRQLGFERPRTRPLVRLGTGRFEDRAPALYRDARSYLRWPVQRIVRIAAFAAVGGIALAGLWQGTTALAIGVALLSYLSSLEAVEPFAQELDHPLLLDAAPVNGSGVLLAHLAAASVIMTMSWAIVAVVAIAITGSADLAVVAALAVVPAAVAAAGGGAISIKPIGVDADAGLMLPSEVAGPRAVLRLVWPIALAGIGTVPVILAREAADRGDDLLAVSGPAIAGVALVAALVVTWIRVRDDFAAAAAQATGRR